MLQQIHKQLKHLKRLKSINRQNRNTKINLDQANIIQIQQEQEVDIKKKYNILIVNLDQNHQLRINKEPQLLKDKLKIMLILLNKNKILEKIRFRSN